jgi:hypothetical protein
MLPDLRPVALKNASPNAQISSSWPSTNDPLCDGFSHVVSNKSKMQVNRKTSYFCMQDKEPLLLRGHPRAGR